MVGTREQAIINGRKSKGPKTERGKAISVLNGKKHGILSTKPPLLEGEDLRTFQGLLRSLTSEFAPQSPTEIMLIEQAAMGYLRLHRCWKAESAMVEQQILEARLKEFPQRQYQDADQILDEHFGQKTDFHPDWLNKEGKILESLIKEADWWLNCLPKRAGMRKISNDDLLKPVQNYLKQVTDELEKFPSKAIPTTALASDRAFHAFMEERDRREAEKASVWHFCSALQRSLTTGPYAKTLKEEIEALLAACHRRMEEIQAILDLVQAEKDARIVAKCIPTDSDRLMKYERHIQRSLNDALERLWQIKERRVSGIFIGSVEKN